MTLVVAGKRARRGLGPTLLAVVLGCLLAMLAFAAPASAHAVLTGSSPEDGSVLEQALDAVELRFNEPVNLIDGAIRLFPGDGAPQTLGGHTVDTTVVVSLPTPLADGSYALSYRVVSADGHPVSGAISFQIGAAPSSSPAPAVDTVGTPRSTELAVSALTGLQYLGLLLFSGLVFFDRIVLRAHSDVDPRTASIARIGLGTAIITSLLLIPASAVRVLGSGLGTILRPGAWLSGVLWQPVAAAATILAAGVGAALFTARPASTLGRRVSVLLAAVAVSTPIFVGHTQTITPGWLIVGADVGHLLLGAFWIGGVVGLLALLARGSPAGEAEFAARVTMRFSQFALYSVVFLLLSGIVMALLIVGDVRTLVGTGYGQLLLLKVGVVALVVALAAWNRTRLLPTIAREPTSALRWASLRRILCYEAALLATVLAITGFLTNASPDGALPETPAVVSRSVVVHAESQGLAVDGTLSPTAAGENILAFRLTYDGAPLTPEQVQIEARLPVQQLGPFTGVVELDPSTGDYGAALTMPVSGDWQIAVRARVSTYAQPIVIFPVTIR